MSGEHIFGPLIDGGEVEDRVIAHLRGWEPTHRAEIERRRADDHGWDNGLAPIKDYRVTHAADDKWPEDQLPMILALCPGLAGQPSVDGSGKVTVPYTVGIIAIASGIDRADAKAIARAHLAVATLSILQHRSIGGLAESVKWVDGRNQEVTRGVDLDRNLFSASAIFQVSVPEAIDMSAGVAQPLSDPDTEPADRPTVDPAKRGLEVSVGS
jgi:hypothetical protein